MKEYFFSTLLKNLLKHNQIVWIKIKSINLSLSVTNGWEKKKQDFGFIVLKIGYMMKVILKHVVVAVVVVDANHAQFYKF